jgi:hypothetical protein
VNAATGQDGTSLRVVVVAHGLAGSVRFVGPVIHELLDRGHRVHMALEPPAWKHERDRWLNEIAQRDGFTWGIVESWRRDPWFVVARWLRRTDDYVRYLLIGADRIPYLVRRAAGRAPRSGRALTRLPGHGSRRGRRMLSRVLSALDASVPTSARTIRYLREQRADVLVVVPVLMPGSTDSAYLRAAARANIPSALCVPSWDNLSSKQLIRAAPDTLMVWNDTQRREARELHGIPAERVTVTGAQCFDHWFDWEARDREAFCARVGLDPKRPFLLYAGGALFPGDLTEAEFARRWILDLRASDDPALRDVAILVRPHPKRVEEWLEVPFDDLDGVVVWPRADRRMPIGREAREDYFDSIHHSVGVVGINTSAMIESAIVGRPVFTVLVPEFHDSQTGTFHFEYVLDVGGGFVRTAQSLEELRAQLAALLTGSSDGGLEAGRRFVESFVRPHGLDRAATPLFVDAIEELARAGATVEHAEPAWGAVLRLLLLPGYARVQARRARLKIALEVGRATGRGGRIPATAVDTLGDDE